MTVLDVICLDGVWPVLGPISGDGIARHHHMEHVDYPLLWALPGVVA
jgi:hypothetical protein